MDPKVSQFPGKSLPTKSKFIRKVPEPPISRQKRVFGTVRSTNIPIKTANERLSAKPSIPVLPKQPKLSRVIIQSAANADKKLTDKLNPRLKKKSPVFKERVKGTILKDLDVENVVEPRTPVAVALPRLFKSKNGGTPYHTAEKCSKCRFDKMETSSYWLSQIKLAESVGKHFVSASFFRLACECNAEPIRNLRVELKHYLSRHEHLSVHSEWKDVCLSYGLLKDDSNVGSQNSCSESIMPEISIKELNKDQIEAIESNIPEISKELNNDLTEATESSIPEISSGEVDKEDHIAGTETSQSCQDSLSLEARQINHS